MFRKLSEPLFVLCSIYICGTAIHLEYGGFDAHNQMERYTRWWREGHLSSMVVVSILAALSQQHYVTLPVAVSLLYRISIDQACLSWLLLLGLLMR